MGELLSRCSQARAEQQPGALIFDRAMVFHVEDKLDRPVRKLARCSAGDPSSHARLRNAARQAAGKLAIFAE